MSRYVSLPAAAAPDAHRIRLQIGRSLCNERMEEVRRLPDIPFFAGDKDPDGVAQLCSETIDEGNSVLMFCASKKVIVNLLFRWLAALACEALRCRVSRVLPHWHPK